MNNYSFIKYLKKENDNRCILIKNGYFYQVFNNDALIIKYLFDFKITYLNDDIKRVGFPKTNIDKVINKLDDEKINYTVIDDVDNIIDKEYDNNNYNKILNIVIGEYEMNKRLDYIISQIRKKANNDNIILDRIEELLR